MRAKLVKNASCENKLAIDLPELMALTCSGRHTAVRIAREAGAEIKIGARRLYNVQKIQAYLDRISEGDCN